MMNPVPNNAQPPGEEPIERLRQRIQALEKENRDLRQQNMRWMRMAGTSDLTGLPNTIFFARAIIPSELGKSIGQHDRGLSFIMLAPDNLGAINQEYGRQVGDQIVEDFAEFLKEQLDPETDKLGHLDGANFLIMSVPSDINNARKKANIIKAKLVMKKFDCDDKQISLTASMGVVAAETIETTNNFKIVVDEIFARLTEAFDQAKKRGGSRIESDTEKTAF